MSWLSTFRLHTHTTCQIIVLDTAKDIYRNATMEKVDLLRMLIVRERSAAEQTSKLNENIEVGPASNPAYP